MAAPAATAVRIGDLLVREGLITKEQLDKALQDPNSPTAGRDVDKYLSEFASTQVALGVLPTDEQVAASCVFLASAASDYVNGQTIYVDGGMLAAM